VIALGEGVRERHVLARGSVPWHQHFSNEVLQHGIIGNFLILTICRYLTLRSESSETFDEGLHVDLDA